jgi:hypothetical protein
MFGYLDGASVSMITAAVAGGGAGIAVLFRMYGNRILGVFSKKRRARADAAREELVGAADTDQPSN